MTEEELVIPRSIADEMVQHSVEARPNEACGLLASSDGALVHCYRMINAAASPVRYSLDTKEQFRCYREMDDRGWQLGGVFHSHTRTEAYPSPTDVRMASEDVPYLIVSLASEPASIRAFRIVKGNWTDEDGTILELPVVID